MERSINKEEFVRRIAVKSGKTATDVLTVLNALESVVRDELVNRGIITLPNLLKIEKVVRPAKAAHQRICPLDGKLRNYKAKPAKNVIRVKPLWTLRDAVEGSSVQNL